MLKLEVPVSIPHPRPCLCHPFILLILSWLILGLHPANERRRYKATPSLIGWAQTISPVISYNTHMYIDTPHAFTYTYIHPPLFLHPPYITRTVRHVFVDLQHALSVVGCWSHVPCWSFPDPNGSRLEIKYVFKWPFYTTLCHCYDKILERHANFHFSDPPRPHPLPSPLKRKCRRFDEIFITGCTESCHFDNFQCSQWWRFRQNDISVSVSSPLLFTHKFILFFEWEFFTAMAKHDVDLTNYEKEGKQRKI